MVSVSGHFVVIGISKMKLKRPYRKLLWSGHNYNPNGTARGLGLFELIWSSCAVWWVNSDQAKSLESLRYLGTISKVTKLEQRKYLTTYVAWVALLWTVLAALLHRLQRIFVAPFTTHFCCTVYNAFLLHRLQRILVNSIQAAFIWIFVRSLTKSRWNLPRSSSIWLNDSVNKNYK